MIDSINVIVETPGGSRQKYIYDPVLNFFKLKKLLAEGMVFPYDFGFVPGTKAEDGDPLDVLVLWEFASFPGCVIECKIIGGIKAKQNGSNKKIRNDRFIVVPVVSKQFAVINEINDLPAGIFSEIKQFFINYMAIEKKGFKYEGYLVKKKFTGK